MKVLVFGNNSGIDGLGGVILASLAFENIHYELCDPKDLSNQLEDYINDNSIYTYDKVFIIDMWIEDPLLQKIADNNELNGKVFVFDHHRSAIEACYDRFPFTKIRVADDLGKCCGTSLFYEYLLENSYLDKEAKGIYKFVELTRKYDTLEWQTRYRDPEPEELALYYNSVGNDNYIERIIYKLKENNFHFSLNENDQKVVEIKRFETKLKISTALKSMYNIKLAGYKCAVLEIEYKYRNELAEFLRDADLDADFIAIIALDKNTVSFRNLNEDVNVRMIAENYGGKGHDFAAFAPCSKELMDALKKD